MKKFTYFIGIDVSKHELDYAVLLGKEFIFHKEDLNSPTSILAFVKELKTIPGFVFTKAVFCMENTGHYCNHLLETLKKLKANIVCESALKIRNSLGLFRHKNDKIDSIRISQYAYRFRDELELYTGRRQVINKMATLFSLRSRLLSVQTLLRTPITQEIEFVKKVNHEQHVLHCKATIQSASSDIQAVDSAIDMLIDGDEHLRRLMKLVTSVDSIGRVTAIQFLISTNEFKSIGDPKKFAAYAGIAPFKSESGKVIGRAKVSKLANRKVKSLLHICAMGSVRYKGELRDYYIRKTQVDGKPKMAVINAIRNKLILRVFACVNQNRIYQRSYIGVSTEISNGH